MKLYQHGQLINGNANSWTRVTRGDWGQRAHWRSNCSCNMKRTLRQLSASTATATATATAAALHALSIRSVGARQLPAPLRPHSPWGQGRSQSGLRVAAAIDGHTPTHTQLPRPVRQRQSKAQLRTGASESFRKQAGAKLIFVEP